MKTIVHGKATGYIYNLKEASTNYSSNLIDPLKEEALFIKSLNSLKEKLKLFKNKQSKNINEIMDVYLAFLDDPVVKDEVIKRINENNDSAGSAYEKVVLEYALKLKKSSNAYLKERSNDLIDLKDKLIKEMYEANITLNFNRPTILVVDQFTTTLALSLTKEVKAVISKTGSTLSHTAIIMKEKNIPYIVINKNFKEGSIVLLKTKENLIEETLSLDEEELEENLNLKILNKVKELDLKIYLNLSSIEGLNNNLNKYYAGVGLVRSELLWINDYNYPSLEKQVNYYKKILVEFYPKVVRVRLFDLKKDKEFFVYMSDDVYEFQFNGIYSKLYKDQLKALMIANEPYGNLEITIPMIRNISEYHLVNEYLKSIKEELNLKRNIPKLGVMLETKEVLDNIKDYLDVDFVSFGTNDLIKDLFKIDREKTFNEEKYLNKILKELKPVAKLLKNKGVPYLYCGDFASTFEGLTKLLSLDDANISIASGFLTEAIVTISDFIDNKAVK